MPMISQLPPAGSVSVSDELPISQSGSVCGVSVGALLVSTQPIILLDSPSLLGRTSLGTGGPERVDVGLGVNLSNGTLVADGVDHATFSSTANLAVEADLVISNQGTPMLMQTSLLRGLFSAGQNIAIDQRGTISSTVTNSIAGSANFDDFIESLQVATTVSAQDLVGIYHTGSNYAITYSNFLDGITIDQAKIAAPADDADQIWVSQGSNILFSQTLSNIWTWIATKLLDYRAPAVEITSNTNLDGTLHNGRLLICSQSLTLSPLINNMGGGFQCTVINVSSGNVVLGSGFISSSGSCTLASWQSATLFCVAYSAGIVAFAAMPPATAIVTLPGQVGSLNSTVVTSTSVTLSWQAPSNGGPISGYIVLCRVTGSTSWTSSPSIIQTTSYQVTELLAATSYDFGVLGINTNGNGPTSSIVTVSTMTDSQAINSITWNVVPSGSYTNGSGTTLSVNAHILPATSPAQFGFSLSASTPPSSWTAAVYINLDLWGAYMAMPSTVGNWYIWAEGLDGSGRTVNSVPFIVQ